MWGSPINGTDEYLLHDPFNNSVIAVVDAQSLQVKVGYNYTPFGTLLVSSLEDYNAVDNALLFAGRELDILGSLLYYFRGRYYSADLHRFISEDPIGFAGGDTNLYRYAENAPHVSNDPTGLGCFEGCDSPGGSSIPLFGLNASDSSGNVLVRGRRFSLNIGAFRNDNDGVNVPDEGVPITLVAQIRGGKLTRGPGYIPGGNYGRSEQTQSILDKKGSNTFLRMDKPTGITEPRLQRTVDQLFKSSDSIPGGAAGAIRNELLTGKPTNGRYHSIKGTDMINRIRNIIK